MAHPVSWTRSVLLAPILLAGCNFQVPSIVNLPANVMADSAGSRSFTGAGSAHALPVASSGSLFGASTLRPFVESEAGRLGVPSGLALAVIQQESGFNSLAVSPVGALGLMQLMPETVQDINKAGVVQVVDPFDSTQNIAGGIWYLKALRQELVNGGKVARGEDWKLALAAYNGGIGRVDSAINAALSGAPRAPQVRWSDIASAMPGETQRYVPSVMALWQKFDR